MSEYIIIEKAIEKRLDTLPDIKPRPFPDDATQLSKATVLAQIIFGYSRSTFRTVQQASAPNASLVVEETASFEFTLKMKGLRTHQGCLHYLSDLKHLMLGFYPLRAKGVKPFTPVAAGFKDVQNGLWYYSLTMSTSFLLTEGDQQFTEWLEPTTLPKEFTINAGIWRSSPGLFTQETSHLDTSLKVWDNHAPVP